MDKALFTYREIARRFDVRVECISGIVKARGIVAIRHPVNHKAKAIDADGLRQVEEALTATVPATVDVS